VKPRKISATVALAVAATGLLSACGASAPPARELADEMIDTLDVSDEVKACMHEELQAFSVGGEGATFSSLDAAAESAAAAEARLEEDPDASVSPNEQAAMQIIDDLEAQLATCN
jgi:hypothetical protein